MKHRLLTTLVGTILCLGWCMSANAQEQTEKTFYMYTKVGGVRYYVSFNTSGKMAMNTTVKSDSAIWKFTVNGSDFNICLDKNNNYIIYDGATSICPQTGGSKQNNYGFAAKSSGTKVPFLVYKSDGTNITKLKDLTPGQYYYFARNKNGASGSNNFMAGKLMKWGNTTYFKERLERTEGKITNIMAISDNGVACANQGDYQQQLYLEDFQFYLVSPTTYKRKFTLTNKKPGYGSVTVDGSSTLSYTIDETIPQPDDGKLHKTYKLKATPNSGYDFHGWSTDEAGENIISTDAEFNYTLDIEGENDPDVTIYANFVEHNDYFLNGEGHNVSNSSLTIVDESTIGSFSVGQDVPLNSIVYKRKITNAAWQPWFTPFEFTLTKELLDNYRFAKIAGAFADVDNDTKYISFVAINNVGETIKANVPYIVYAKNATGTSTTYDFNLGSGTMKATTTNNELTIQSAEQKFTFKGIYATKTSDATDDTPATWYTLNKNGEFKRPRKDVAINGFRFTMEVTDLENNPYFVEGEAGIRVRVFSDMPCDWIDDDPTWVVTPKAKAEASSEAYDLTGRKMSKEGMHRRGQIFIKNGKKYWNR